MLMVTGMMMAMVIGITMLLGVGNAGNFDRRRVQRRRCRRGDGAGPVVPPPAVSAPPAS